MKNKHSSEGGSQKAEHSRAKRKSSTETVAPVEYVFCEEQKKKSRNSLKNYTQHGNTTEVFRVLV